MQKGFTYGGAKSSYPITPHEFPGGSKGTQATAGFLAGVAAAALLTAVLHADRQNGATTRPSPPACVAKAETTSTLIGCEGLIASGRVMDVPEFAPLSIAHRSWGVAENGTHPASELWGRWPIQLDRLRGMYVHMEPIAGLVERRIEPRVGDQVKIVMCKRPTLMLANDAN